MARKTAKKNGRAYLLDISHFIFRAYHAMPEMATSAGVPTNAVRGVASMLEALIREEKPEYLVAVFDPGGGSFRNEVYPEYKANRDEPDEDIKVQFPLVERLVDAMAVSRASVKGYEADDVIATLARRFAEAGHEVTIVSGDKDLMQCVDKKVVMFDPMRRKHFRPADVEERFGVGPGAVADVLGIMGDSSDNLPGVKGVGAKGASALMAHFGSVEAMLERTEEIEQLDVRGAKSLRRKIEEGREDAIKFKDLATVRDHVDLDVNLEEFRTTSPDEQELISFFEEMEMKTLAERVRARPAVSRSQAEEAATPDLVEDKGTEAQATSGPTQTLLETAYLDTETTGLAPHSGDRIVEIAIVDGAGNVLLEELIDPQRQIPRGAWEEHHITNEMVRGKRTLEQAWPDIKKAVEGKRVVIYNVTFDPYFFPDDLRCVGEMCCALERKRSVGRRPHKLKNAADWAGHTWTGQQHRALADTRATRDVWRKLEAKGISWEPHRYFAEAPPRKRWSVSDPGLSTKGAPQTSPRSTRQRKGGMSAVTSERRFDDVRPDLSEAVPDSPFFDAAVVITGEFDSMTRAEVEQFVRNQGGKIRGEVTRNTNFLVTGKKSEPAKIDKIGELISDRHTPEVLSEPRFLRILMEYRVRRFIGRVTKLMYRRGHWRDLATANVVVVASTSAVWPGSDVAPDVLGLCDSKGEIVVQVVGEEDIRVCLRGLEQAGVSLCGYRLKDLCRDHSIHPGSRGLDFGLVSYLYDTSTGDHGPAHVAKAFLQEPPTEDGDVEARLRAELERGVRLLPRLEEALDSHDQRTLYQEIEYPLLLVLADMERRGLLLNSDLLRDVAGDFEARMKELVVRIYKEAGEEFNVLSPQKLRTILFDKLGLPTKGLKRTKTGVSTDSDSLEALSGKHPLPILVLEYRGLAKLKSTYLDQLPGMVDEDSRVHTRLNQTVTATGRLSSSDPNLQNIPVRTEDGARIREAFVAPTGKLLVSADYNQIELRVLAHLSGDEALQEAFAEGRDVHRTTAAELFEVKVTEVTDAMRREAKLVNYGLIYGMGPARLSRELGIEKARAADYIERYFERYSRVRGFYDDMLAQAREFGYVETIEGRRRYLPDIHSDHGGRRQIAERVATNTPIQGSAADIIKIAMVSLYARLRTEGLAAAMVLQIHDELLLECPKGELEQVVGLVCETMSGAADLAVPLVVDVGSGTNWALAH